MKKLVLFMMALSFTFNVAAHCGSCGVGGGHADDHSEGEDKDHHERDARFEEAKKKKEAMMNEEESDDDDQ